MPESIILSHYQVSHLLAANAPAVMSLSPDLGLTSFPIQKHASGWLLPDGSILTISHLEQILEDENSCFSFNDGQLEKVHSFSARTNRYYSLMPTPSAPTMLISGIPMHRVKGTTPDQDTRQKLKALGKPYGCILDTATGLGYTAIIAAQTAEMVVTVEFDPAVLEICRLNPWSLALFTRPNIQPIIGDSADLVAAFSDETFNAIIHDPPTFALAGQLYALETYQNLYRILKPGGRLFHYIGNPDSRYGASTGRGVTARLREAGFRLTLKENAFGVLGMK